MEPGHAVTLEAEKPKRSVRNFLLQPMIQMKFGIYSILLAWGLVGALGAVIFFQFDDLLSAVLALTDAEEDVLKMFYQSWKTTQYYVLLIFLGYILATLAISIVFSHKFIGPTIAFRRHIRALFEGEYGARTYLRKGDAFFEVADELNRLSERLEQKSSSPLQKVDQV